MLFFKKVKKGLSIKVRYILFFLFLLLTVAQIVVVLYLEDEMDDISRLKKSQ